MKFITSVLAAAALTAVAIAPAAAQSTYPDKPIRIVVPYSAGGVVDTIARVIGDKLGTRLGQPVIVENKSGAGGAIGIDFVARAAPDGYTLLLASPALAVLPSLQKSVRWNGVRDFRAVGGIGVVPNIVVVHPSVPAKTMEEFVQLARKTNPPLTYATAGMGTSNHLSGELLVQEAKIKLTHVPYKGQTDALNDLLSGRVTMMPLTSQLAIPQVKEGKLRALGVTTAKRSSASPELPTVAESAKLPKYEVGTWFGLVGPKKMPQAVVDTLSKEVAEILTLPEVKTKLDGIGMDLDVQSAAAFDAYVAAETSKWTRVIKQAGIQPN